MKIPFFVALVGLLTTASASSLFAADTKKTRDEMVIEDREELLKDDSWIYNDLEKAKAAATASNKPLMIVFRCIP